MTFQTLIIGLVAFLLVIIVLSQISKIGDLMRSMVRNQDKAEEDSANMLGTIFAIVGFVGMALLTISYFAARDRFLPVAASELGREWTKSFNFYSIFIVIIFFVTHILLFVFSYKYRYKLGRVVHYFPESMKLEAIWTIIPLIVLVMLAITTTPKWIKATSKPSEDALHIRVTGKQFEWYVAYPGKDNTFGERDIMQFGNIDNLMGLDPKDEAGYDDVYSFTEIVVPVNKEIVFNLSALDVIHDLYLPHFRVKMDAIPGVPTRIKVIPDTTTEEMREITGNPEYNYEIACAELCGTGHWNMRRVLKVVTQEEYDSWIAEQPIAMETHYTDILASIGEPVELIQEENNETEETDEQSVDETETALLQH